MRACVRACVCVCAWVRTRTPTYTDLQVSSQHSMVAAIWRVGRDGAVVAVSRPLRSFPLSSGEREERSRFRAGHIPRSRSWSATLHDGGEWPLRRKLIGITPLQQRIHSRIVESVKSNLYSWKDRTRSGRLAIGSIVSDTARLKEALDLLLRCI